MKFENYKKCENCRRLTPYTYAVSCITFTNEISVRKLCKNCHDTLLYGKGK